LEKKKILIIARDFIPYCFTFGGVVRILKLAEYLGENGFEVFILTAKGEPISYFGYEDLVSRLNVTYLKDRLQPLLNRITDSSSESTLQKIEKSSRAFGLLKKIANELSVPDIGVYFIGKFIRRGARMIREHGIRNVIVTSPPPSTLLVGLGLKKIFGDRIRFIADYRDSWNIEYVAKKSFRPMNSLNRSLEKQVLDSTDFLVAVSKPILENLEARFPGLSNKSLLIMNGYDLTQLEGGYKTIEPHECLHIGHFGRLKENERHRHPGPLFEAIEKFAGRIKLFQYGEVSVSEDLRRRVEGTVKFKGSVPHRGAIEAMGEMDLLLLYHSEASGAKEVVTGKLFEYMLAQRPILVLGPPDMEAAEIVRKEGIGYTVDLFDPQDVERALSEILELWMDGNLIRYDIGKLRHYSRQYQYSKILKYLHHR
jgi:glycosyltransferase involved in cell wall biosynthesis